MEIHLFVQEGCRPCLYAETQLKKCNGWEDVINITNSKVDGEWSNFAKQCGVTATPTLIALENNEVVAKVTGSQQMTSDFWRSTIQKHKRLDVSQMNSKEFQEYKESLETLYHGE